MICKTKSFCAVAVPVLVNCSEKLQGTLFSTKSLQRCSNSLMILFYLTCLFLSLLHFLLDIWNPGWGELPYEMVRDARRKI